MFVCYTRILYFCSRKVRILEESIMCTVNINIDEAALRDIHPELNTTAAIRHWVQELVDSYMQQMEFEDTETISIEEAREMTLAAVREEYAKL